MTEKEFMAIISTGGGGGMVISGAKFLTSLERGSGLHYRLVYLVNCNRKCMLLQKGVVSLSNIPALV